ncbi:MAG: hypothetical protein ABIZ81_09180 [Opitutaceae bacterium]
MYPDGDLNALSAHKLALQRRIFFRREECVELSTRVAGPLKKADHFVAQWRRISPLAKVAAVPIALLFKRKLFPRSKLLGPLLRWGPLAFKILRGFKAAR